MFVLEIPEGSVVPDCRTDNISRGLVLLVVQSSLLKGQQLAAEYTGICYVVV